MKRILTQISFILIAMVACFQTGSAQSHQASSEKGRFEAGDGTFLLNGEPFVVKAAELHYPRIPREYWDHRIKMSKALGMNTVCLYVFWNAHESREGVFDFTGQNDLRAFVELCRDNDMKVILRPGPYVCAEWEMGGLPWWLLKHKDIRLREADPYFLERVDIFQQKVAEQVGDLTVDKGGPIIMVQVENEYGSYGTDKPYVATIRDMLRKNFGGDVTLFQCDWASNFENNGLDDLIWTMNFGTGADIDEQFARLKELRPDSPLMCSEFWSGWFDKWGANHETRPADAMIAGIDEMLSKGISFSLYMTHGGTNWGHWAGANSPGFAPDVTSYDYDAPINEQGAPTPKYNLLRKTLAKYMDGNKQPKVPAPVPVGNVKEFKFTEFAPLPGNLGKPHSDKDIRTMEEYDQGFGSMIYSTTLPELKETSLLTVDEPHDYAQIFINGRYIGALDRRLGETQIAIPPCRKEDRLDILVEALGRINFGRAIKDFKGITGSVSVTEDRDGYPFTCKLRDWNVYLIPDAYDTYKSMTFKDISEAKGDPAGSAMQGRMARGVYRGTFNVSKPADTFLDFSTWGKGLVYVNGHPLGRIWEIGPQQTLYTPGCWLREGENEILVFDILGPREAKSRGLKKPVIDCLQFSNGLKRLDKMPDLNNAVTVAEGEFDNRAGWQQVDFTKAARGRNLLIEALDGFGSDDVTSIAELYLLDAEGNRISREGWKIMYTDSEDAAANRTGEKTFDLQESTCWSTQQGVPFPHTILIDLGRDYDLTALQYLPRPDTGTPGAIRRYRLRLLP